MNDNDAGINEDNPHELAQEALSVFGQLNGDEAESFLKNSPLGEIDGLQYIAAAALLKRDRNELAAFLGITEDAAHRIMGWAFAEIMVTPMMLGTDGR